MQNTIHGLIKKRGGTAGQHRGAQRAADVLMVDLDAMDRTLVLCSHDEGLTGVAPRGK